ncbi:hypothetical protein ACFQYP_58100 [Nonomuraea antimicrobica]
MLTDRDVDLKPKPVLAPSPGSDPYTAPAVQGGGEWRVLETDKKWSTLVVAVDLEEVDAITRRLALIELLGGGGILLILAVAGVTIVRRSMRPLGEIERTAEAISGASSAAGCRTATRVPRWAAWPGRSTGCWPRSRAPSPPGRPPRRRPAALRTACGSSSATPPTSCAPR